MSAGPELLTIPQAAARRGCPAGVIYAACADGRLPWTGGQVRGDKRVLAADVDKLKPYRPYGRRGRNAGAHVAEPQPGVVHAARRSRAKPVEGHLRCEQVADRWDAQLTATFTQDELRTLSYSLHFSVLSGRLRGYEPEVVRGLMLRFARVVDEHTGELVRATAEGRPADAPPRPLHLAARAATTPQAREHTTA